ncbi:hypothetical protein AC1031_007925 [Aphanomyces cochlioides]|nr:hypothetical protein AC1031_007925 [Aphanomyces cochlioides]
MSQDTAALTPLKSPIVFSNITFISRPRESFVVEINDKTPDESPSLLLLESTGSKLAWTARLNNVQGDNTFNASAPKSTIVDVLKEWLNRESNGQEKQSSAYQVDLKQSSGGSMCLLLAIKDFESRIVHGYWWHLHPSVFNSDKSVSDMMEHLCKELDFGDDVPELFAVQTGSKYTKAATFVVWTNMNKNVITRSFELVDGGTAIKVLKAGQYQVEYCTLSTFSGALRHEVYLNSKRIHIYQANHSPHKEIKTLSIHGNSKLRLFVASEKYDNRLTWIFRKL